MCIIHSNFRFAIDTFRLKTRDCVENNQGINTSDSIAENVNESQYTALTKAALGNFLNSRSIRYSKSWTKARMIQALVDFDNNYQIQVLDDANVETASQASETPSDASKSIIDENIDDEASLYMHADDRSMESTTF